MIRVLHLLDDIRVGGITKGLPEHLRHLSDGFAHRVESVNTAFALSGPIDADMVVIHFTVSWAKLPFMLSLRARLGRRPLIVAEHSYTEMYEKLRVPVRARFRTMLRISLGLADHVVAVSRAQGTWLRDAKIVRSNRLTAIPQGRDLSALRGILPPVAHTGPLRLGAYGRFVDQKGFDILIEAMRLVPADVATLDIAGYGEDRDALIAAAADLDHVRIGGPIAGPAEFLASVDAIAIPSRWEAFGLVGAEARAAARPVVATAVDGLVEQIQPEWGALCRPKDPMALAAAIRSLAGRDLAAMGEAGRRSVQPEFGRTIAGWYAVLHAMAAKLPKTQTARWGAAA